MTEKILVAGIMNCDRNFQIPQFIKSLKSLINKNCKIACVDVGSIKDFRRFYRNAKGIDFMEFERKGSEQEAVAAAREHFRKKAIDEGYDWLLLVDQSIILPEDFPERAIATGRKVISGLYFETAQAATNDRQIIRSYVPNLFSFSGKDEKKVDVRRFSFDDVLPARVLDADMAELNAIMLHRSILEKIVFIHQDRPMHAEIYFAYQCRKRNEKIAVDSSMVCRNNRTIVMDAFT